MVKLAASATRQILLDEGLRIAALKGLRGLKVRELAASSGVNLGSFVYHFGQRERFIAELVELWYAPMYAQIRQVTSEPNHDSAVQRLHSSFLELITLVHQHAGFIKHLLFDALAGEAAAREFLLSIPGRHPKLLLELIAQAQQDGQLVQASPHHLMVFVMSSVGLPLLLASGPSIAQDWLSADAVFWKEKLAQPSAARQRLEWALRGIRTAKGTT